MAKWTRTKESQMPQKRNRRSGVEDRWRRTDGTPSARAGKGKRWMARFVDNQGRENAKAFLKANPDIAGKIEALIRQNAGLIAEKILAGEEGEAAAEDAAEG